jgi:hypothetical protein
LQLFPNAPSPGVEVTRSSSRQWDAACPGNRRDRCSSSCPLCDDDHCQDIVDRTSLATPSQELHRTEGSGGIAPHHLHRCQPDGSGQAERPRIIVAIFFLGIGVATVATGFCQDEFGAHGRSCRDPAIDRDLPPDRASDARRPRRASGVRSASTRYGQSRSQFFGTTALIGFGLLTQHTQQIVLFSPK